MRLQPQQLSVGDYLRIWRQRRGRSQLDLALDAETSQRHLSFIESGRSMPSRDMLLNLAARLDVPLRDRNTMLLAAGFAPVFSEHGLDAPALAEARSAIDTVLKGHEPYPALAVDRRWNLVAANAALPPLLADIEDRTLLQGTVNVLRLSLHPRGLAPRIANFAEWRDHLLDRMRRQITVTGDEALGALLQELSAYPAQNRLRVTSDRADAGHAGVCVPLQLVSDRGLLSFFSTTTLFGTPRDVTLSELAIEAFFPADDDTRSKLLSRDPAKRDRSTAHQTG